MGIGVYAFAGMDTPPALPYDPRVSWNALPELPPRTDLETPAILKACIEARVTLARVNALAESLPNRSILIHALPLQEAGSSSEIENIVTKGDELYQAHPEPGTADVGAGAGSHTRGQTRRFRGYPFQVALIARSA